MMVSKLWFKVQTAHQLNSNVQCVSVPRFRDPRVNNVESTLIKSYPARSAKSAIESDIANSDSIRHPIGITGTQSEPKSAIMIRVVLDQLIAVSALN